jgi:Arc/MetJ-type ribon-helix-helix transcriptional regulator
VDFDREQVYIYAMNVSLPREQLEWLEAEVAAGHFSSVEEALATAVADLKVLHDDDLAWAKPYLDKARTCAARGEVISGDEFLNRLDAKVEALRSK